jgi:hypothetical protein
MPPITPFPGNNARSAAIATRRPAKQRPEEPGIPSGLPSVAALPPYLPLKRACDVAGVGRSRMYKLIDAGLVRAVKSGPKSTLVDVGSLLKYLETLPLATSAAEAKAQARALRAKRRAKRSGKSPAMSPPSPAPGTAGGPESDRPGAPKARA